MNHERQITFSTVPWLSLTMPDLSETTKSGDLSTGKSIMCDVDECSLHRSWWHALVYLLGAQHPYSGARARSSRRSRLQYRRNKPAAQNKQAAPWPSRLPLSFAFCCPLGRDGIVLNWTALSAQYLMTFQLSAIYFGVRAAPPIEVV